jgi:hypothetical protein
MTSVAAKAPVERPQMTARVTSFDVRMDEILLGRC